MKIPESLIELVKKQDGDILREDVSKAHEEMKKLGIPSDSKFWAFFSEYNVCAFDSEESYE